MIRDIKNKKHYIAREGKTIIRKKDNFNMGDEIWLGIDDQRSNYKSVKVKNNDN